MGSKGSNTQQTTTTTGPPAEVMQRYRELLGRADTVSQTPYAAYSGPRVANFTPDQMAAFQGVRDAVGLSRPYTAEAAGFARAGAAPIGADAIQRYMDPYTQSVVDATAADFDVQNRRAQSQTAGQAAMSGAYGDSAAVAKALTAEGQSRVQAPILAQLRSQGYGQALAAAQQDRAAQGQAGYTMGQLGQLAQGQELQGQAALLQTGGLQQALAQAGLDVPYQTYLEQRAYPFQTTQWLAGIDSSIAPGMGSTSTQTSPAPNRYSPYVGALTAGLGLAGRMFGFASGGAVMPYDGATMPFATAPTMVPAGQLQRIQMPVAQVAQRQEQPPDPEMGKLVSGLGAATDGLRKLFGRGQQPGSGSTNAYADGGEVMAPPLQFDPRIPGGLGIPISPPSMTSRFAPGIKGDTEQSQRFSPGLGLDPTSAPWQASVTPAARPPQAPQGAMVPQSAPAEPPPQESPPQAPPAEGDQQSFAMSPWSALTTAGLGMMASKSPTLAGAIGEGGLAGMKALQDIDARRMQQRRIQMEADRLAQQAREHQQRLGLDERRLGLEERRVATSERTADQGRFTFAPTGDGQGIIALNTRDGTVRTIEGQTMGRRSGDRTSVFEVRRQAYLNVHPGDEQGALDFASGRRTLGQPEISKSALSAAQRDAKEMALTGDKYAAFVRQRAAEYERHLKSGFGQSPTQPPNATPPAGVPAISGPSATPPVPPSLAQLKAEGRLERDAGSGRYRDKKTGQIYNPDGTPLQ